MNPASPVERFIEHTLTALRSGSFIRLLISAPADRTQAVERITGRLIELKGQTLVSLTAHEARRDITDNLPLDAIPGWLARQLDGRFRSAVLEATGAQWQYITNSKGRARLVSHKSNAGAAPTRTHDLPKASVLDESARPWLEALGVLDPTGRVRASMADKHRQIERYLEIISHLAPECGWKAGTQIRLADMGCGKGYLTFGLWHLLTKTLGMRVELTGVETREELVTKANALARTINATALHFVTGDIASFDFDHLDGLIALHACNTATDKAIAQGVRAGAKLIVASPCCHQELRPRLGCPELFAPLLAHGLLTERFSEWLTDGLRVLRLQQAGYHTKIIEFVSPEHTPRNLLIVGVRKDASSADNPASGQIHALKDFFRLGPLASDDIGVS